LRVHAEDVPVRVAESGGLEAFDQRMPSSVLNPRDVVLLERDPAAAQLIDGGAHVAHVQDASVCSASPALAGA